MSAAQPFRPDLEMDVFEMALSLPPADRLSYLEAACQGDRDLIKRVQRRVAWETRMQGFLLAPVFVLAEADDPFQAGDLVANRFEIVRRAGEGGMAVVYEAIDRKTERRLAIKVPRLEFRKRLVPELRNALQVTHSNICRVNEVHTAQTRLGEIDFLTMEYLDGETLAERLLREPLPTPEEAKWIIGQVCAGMSEAHARGVVHGDLKPDNVILVQADNGIRAVITDFGLARLTRGVLPPHSAASLRGAPDFVAPELWQGHPSSRETDMYALGVLMYELITGTRPFSGSPAPRRGGQSPRPLQDFAPTAPKPWNDTIFACLSVRPEERPRDAIHVAQALAAARSSPRRFPLIAALVCATLAVGSVPTAPGSAPPGRVVKLAMLPPQSDPALAATANGIALDLCSRWKPAPSGRAVVLIPLSSTIRYRVHSRETALPVLGATHTLQLTARSKGNGIEVGASLYDTQARRQVRQYLGSYTGSNLFEVRQNILAAINAALRTGLVERTGDLKSAAYWPYVQAAYYLNGEPNPRKAEELLRQGALTDPQSPSILMLSAEAVMADSRQSNDPGALAKAMNFIEAARGPGLENSAASMCAARLYEQAGNLDRATQEYRKALTIEPRNGEALRSLADVLAARGLTEQAAQSFALAAEAEPEYFAPALQAGHFYYRRGRYVEAERNFWRAIELAPDLAKAHHNLAAVLTDTARYPAAEAEFQQALNLDRTAATMAGMGALLAYEGRHAESVYYYELAVTLGPADFLFFSNLADAYRRTGRSAEARRTYEKSLDAAERDLAGSPKDSYTRAFRAYILGRLGQVRKAETAMTSLLLEAPSDMKVLRRAAILFEAIGKRDRALAVLRRVTPVVLSEISHSPDMSLLVSDSRFLDLQAIK